MGVKLIKELPGILNWAIAGCSAWQKDGINPPKVVTDATRSYRTEMDLMGEWMSQNCNIGAAYIAPSKALYEDYRSWCVSSGIKPLTSVVFGRKLEDRGIGKSHTRDGNKFNGVEIKSRHTYRLAIAA